VIKMKKHWILVAMLGTCLLWAAKTWGVENFSSYPNGAGGYFGQVGGKNFSSYSNGAGGYFGQVDGKNFSSYSNGAGGYFGQVDGKNFSSYSNGAGGYFGQVDGGYSGYSGYGGYKGNRIGGNGIEHSFIPMATAPMAGQPVGGNEIENFSSTGNKTIGGGIITTTNSKMPGLPFQNLPAAKSTGWSQAGPLQKSMKRPTIVPSTRPQQGPVLVQQGPSDPMSIVEDETRQGLKQLHDYFDTMKYDLDQQNLKPQEYLAKIDQLRQQVKEAEFTIHQKAQARIDNMGQIIQLMKEGTLSKEAGQRALWRVVGLDDENINAMLPKTKPIDAEIHAKQAQLPKPAKGMITGIIYSENSPSALLNSQIIHEGDIIQGIKVVKIRKGAVEFEKDGKKWTQAIGETPAVFWK